MTKGYNLWLEWEAYKMRHPEERQVLEWQEQYYRRFRGCPAKYQKSVIEECSKAKRR